MSLRSTTTQDSFTMHDPASVGAGRYAPSPSGDLHLGNLRTAILAWLLARQEGLRFVMRIEDLDRVRPGAAEQQLADLKSLGLDWDATPGEDPRRHDHVLRQSTRLAAYDAAVQKLQDAGLLYECYCTRREILEATSAPHGIPGSYPGTCRNLSDTERKSRREIRPPALRLRAEISEFTVQDMFAGEYTGAVDDVVVRRNDGTYAYNLAVVVDDHYQGVTQVVRGDDLLSSAPRQAYLAALLGYEPPHYAHVPLALNTEGKRLAKRDGAVTLRQLRDAGFAESDILEWIRTSIPIPDAPQFPKSAQDFLEYFDPKAMSSKPWIITNPLDL